MTTTTFTYRKRLFLSSVSTGHTSHVLAEVESSRDGQYKFGSYMLTLADCKRAVHFEFFLGNARARRQSLAKIDLLLRVLSDFRAALVREAQLITGYERKGRRLRKERAKP
ncbi:MAG TPA: hypothetical protein VJ023_03520 [Pyrinomonadaceae bacterium]|nr:hypothetical protein [Pyrinomonadaceae bacterium]